MYYLGRIDLYDGCEKANGDSEQFRTEQTEKRQFRIRIRRGLATTSTLPGYDHQAMFALLWLPNKREILITVYRK